MTLTDDDLGARLRAALQEVTPLATDPVPPPRFVPVDAGVAGAGASRVADGPDLVVVGAPERAPRRRRRVAAVSLLAAAAVAATAVALTVDLDRGEGSSPSAGSSAVPTPLSTETVPDRDGAFLGVVPDPDPWRCTASAGSTLAATQDRDQFRPTVWAVAPGVTCSPYPADRGRFQFSDDGHSADFGDGGPDEITGAATRDCLYVATATSAADPSFESRGAVDYLEFYGSGCRLALPVTPPTGPGDGLFTAPDVVRCSAPAGATVSATHTTSPDHLDVWTVSGGVACVRMSGERDRYTFDPPRARDATAQPASIEGTSACLVASTGGLSYASRGDRDYLEFFGPSCLIRSAAR